jgi:hypothetical protein
MATGLGGEYCWQVSLRGETGQGDIPSARTEPAAAPVSPTAEELAQTVA